MTIIFFFNDTATTEIYTLSLHDALPISVQRIQPFLPPLGSPISIFSKPARSGQMTRSPPLSAEKGSNPVERDRKSTRLNSSHSQISYAVFCLKKKKDDASRAHTPRGYR